MKTLTTELLGGRTMSDTTFDTLLNAARAIIEGMRPWKILEAEDSSKTAQSGKHFDTAISLPSDFRQYIQPNIQRGKYAVVLRNGDDTQGLIEKPFERRLDYKDSFGYFVVDYANSNLYIMGEVPKSYTIYQYYIRRGTTIDTTNSWEFPSDYHAILPHMVAALQKGGVDYDDINARQVLAHDKEAQALLSAMEMWDDQLQRAAIGV